MSRSQREVFGETLAELAATDPRVVVLDGDLATSTRADIVAEQAPDAFVQVGIAEQNMVGMAVGMATCRLRPVALLVRRLPHPPRGRPGADAGLADPPPGAGRRRPTPGCSTAAPARPTRTSRISRSCGRCRT